MTHTPELTFRPARDADRDAVFAMVATVWGGTDYIPQIWEKWLHATTGPLLVGTLGEQPVALTKLTSLSPNEDWLEGLRIDPAMRGRGYARALVRHILTLCAERGARTLRYQTDATNATMQRLGAELGFRLVLSPGQFSTPLVQATPEFVPLPAERIATLWNDVAADPQIKHNGGLYTYGWTSYDMTPERIAFHAARQHIFGLPGEHAWAIREPRFSGGYWVAYAHGEPGPLERLLQALRADATPPGAEPLLLNMHLTASSPLIPRLLAAGFTNEDHASCVYEYRIG